MTRRLRLSAALLIAPLLAACAEDGAPETDAPGAPAAAASTQTGAAQPLSSAPLADPGRPDPRGVVIHDDYAAIQAGPGDSVASMAARVNLTASELAAYNGLPLSYVPRAGDELVLPPRPGGYGSFAAAPAASAGAATTPLSQPSPQTETVAAGEWSPALIGEAIEDTGGGAATGASPSGDAQRIVYHDVQQGETAQSIAASYGVPLDTLVSWNALSGPAYAVTPGQVLTIPAASGAPTASGAPLVSLLSDDGVGPPSVESPLPGDTAEPPTLESPQLGQYQTATPTIEPNPPLPPVEETAAISEPAPAPVEAAQPATGNASAETGKLLRPVPGRIVRPYNRARGASQNDGVDFAATAGEPVKASAAGTVALVSTSLGEWGDIVLIRHPSNIMTVYGRLAGVTVRKGQAVEAGQTVGSVAEPRSGRAMMHFEVRRGAFSEDPEGFL